LYCPVAKVEAEHSFEDDERLVGLFVVVPDEIALYLDEFELIVVHFRYVFGLPVLAEERKLARGN
jgi:hypothetical protein